MEFALDHLDRQMITAKLDAEKGENWILGGGLPL